MQTTVLVTVRRATQQDGGLLLAWRNDPETRANSVHQGVVRPEEHEAWLGRRLGDSRCLLLIGLDTEGSPLGQVRFDLVQDGEAEASITVAPERRGEGYGAALLAAGCAEAFRALGVRRITASIRPGNAASRRIFERVGFGGWMPAAREGGEFVQCCLPMAGAGTTARKGEA